MAMELINRRRRQLHLHSVLYYLMDECLVSDETFDHWAKSLVGLQEANPQSKVEGYRPDLFRDWTGETGMHLLATEEMLGLAKKMLERK